MAFFIFTIPLFVALNLVAGGWIAQTEEIVRRSTRVLIALEMQAKSLDEMSYLMVIRDAKIEDGFKNLGLKVERNTSSVEGLSIQIEKLSEGQSAP